MRDYLIAVEALEELIELATPDSIPELCKQLDEFWKSYCETDMQFLWLIRWTRHDHAAKGAWASLDHQLRCKLKEFNIEV